MIQVVHKNIYHLVDMYNMLYYFRHVYPSDNYYEVVNHNLVLEKYEFFSDETKELYNDYMEIKYDLFDYFKDLLVSLRSHGWARDITKNSKKDFAPQLKVYKKKLCNLKQIIEI